MLSRRFLVLENHAIGTVYDAMVSVSTESVFRVMVGERITRLDNCGT